MPTTNPRKKQWSQKLRREAYRSLLLEKKKELRVFISREVTGLRLQKTVDDIVRLSGLVGIKLSTSVVLGNARAAVGERRRRVSNVSTEVNQVCKQGFF